MASFDRLFVTLLARSNLGTRLNPELTAASLLIAAEDRAGQRWSKKHGYRGYTSYASLNDLPLRAPVFADLVKRIDRDVAAFGRKSQFDLNRRRLKLDSLWVNVMEKDAVHTAHIHPHSVISGTYYVAVPPGSGVIRFEDPRLALMMAAPARKTNARLENRAFVDIQPRPGLLLLWESWLRHGVEPNKARGRRISVSFNYRLD
ncbi:MAG TPA: TIGR02466 family protein [Rhizomicrobium sp.]|nr:TIGR02466 family protein [Rhizomicrobium sp.]